MIFNNLQTFNNTLTLMTIVFNKYLGTGPTASVIASVLSGQIDAKKISVRVRCEEKTKDKSIKT
jgi:hypothetical protein